MLMSRRAIAAASLSRRAIALASLSLSSTAAAPPRTVLVTGAARGIGEAIAHRFASGGDRVLVHYRSDAAAAEAVRASLPKARHDEHLCLHGDLAEAGAASALLAAATKAAGHVDVLVVNHGVYEETPIETATAEEWSSSFERLLKINLAAPAELAYAFGQQPHDRGGAIVFVSSRGALRGEPLAPAYGASKAGLNSLTGSLAQALAPRGVRVAAVAPGFVATEMARPVLAGERGDSIRAQSPFGRVGEPHEVASAVHFLASEEGAWSSGAVLDCNGASYLH